MNANRVTDIHRSEYQATILRSELAENYLPYFILKSYCGSKQKVYAISTVGAK